MPRVGVLMNTNMDADQQASVSAFVQALRQLGWTNGHNVRIDIRWAGGEPAEICRHVEDLVALTSDVLGAIDVSGSDWSTWCSGAIMDISARAIS